jgi:hypothetical protein
LGCISGFSGCVRARPADPQRRDSEACNDNKALGDALNFWINKRVTLNDSWGPGAAHTLTTPLRQQPEFSLRPRYLRDAQGNRQLAHFSIDFPSGFLADGWGGVNFTLEGVIPHLGPQGGVGYNKVRLFYVSNAVQGPIPDLVVIKIATHVAIPGTVQARQDGSGHGPPH